MNSIVLKRIGAYFIDLFLITFISFLIIQIPFINPYSSKYEKTYNKYMEIQEKYDNEEINKKEYETQTNKLSYKMDKYNFPYTLVTTVCLFGYFILFQYFNNGQTVGKKIMKIRIKGYKNKKLTFMNYFIRGIVLNNIIIDTLMMLCLFITNKTIYYNCTFAISIIQVIFMYANIITILFKKDNRGLHDLLANTKVVEVDNKIV